MRILDKASLPYEVFTYEHGDGAVDGISVAKLLNQKEETVFKTLVTIANTKEYFVFVIPVAHELNLKACAKAAGVKSVEMIHVKDINKITGYIRGGCSPIGMKKHILPLLKKAVCNMIQLFFSRQDWLSN